MRHRLAITPLCVTLGALASPGVHAQRVVVFDATSEFRPSAVPPAHQVVVRRDVLPVARQLWSNAQGCRGDFRMLDFAPGSFTAPGAPQRAVLYRYCQTGPGAAKSGIAILQAGRMVAHVAIEGMNPDGLAAARDVNRDGVWELMVVDTTVRPLQLTAHLSILQIVADSVRSFGRTRVIVDDTPTGRRHARAGATVLYATPGRRPKWEAEIWYSGEHRNVYRALTAMHPVTLGRDRATYRRIR